MEQLQRIHCLTAESPNSLYRVPPLGDFLFFYTMGFIYCIFPLREFLNDI